MHVKPYRLHHINTVITATSDVSIMQQAAVAVTHQSIVSFSGHFIIIIIIITASSVNLAYHSAAIWFYYLVLYG
jgi:hypothetical protein